MVLNKVTVPSLFDKHLTKKGPGCEPRPKDYDQCSSSALSKDNYSPTLWQKNAPALAKELPGRGQQVRRNW